MSDSVANTLLRDFFDGRTLGFLGDSWTWRGEGYDDGWETATDSDIERLLLILNGDSGGRFGTSLESRMTRIEEVLGGGRDYYPPNPYDLPESNAERIAALESQQSSTDGALRRLFAAQGMGMGMERAKMGKEDRNEK